MKILVLLSALALSACSSPSLQGLLAPARATAPATGGTAAAPETAAAPVTSPLPPPPPPTARTADQFDTTTAADRAAAVTAPAGERALGVTLATLGSPADPGIWIKTPQVSEVTQGRVVYQGTSINIELRPSGGAAGSGSQISLPAMRLLGAPLTGIVEVSVFAA